MEIPAGAVAGGVGAAKLLWEMAARETLGMDPAHGTQPRGHGDIPETPPLVSPRDAHPPQAALESPCHAPQRGSMGRFIPL